MEILDLNNLGWPNDHETDLYLWIDFKTKKEISSRPFVGSSALKDKCNESSTVCFLKQRE